MIEIRHLTVRYDDTLAVDDLSLRLEPGDALAFIGPNGAGKTSTIKVLATLQEPASGDIIIHGHSVIEEPERVREHLGYMPDQFGLYDGMQVREYLEFFAAAYGLQRRDRSRKVDDVLELTELGMRADDMVESLSLGLRQRVCLARTLIHDPAVLVLDEPASGLDPRARVEFRELMKVLTGMGKTLFVSSHILPELADFCNKVGILEGGRLVEFGTVDDILGRVQQLGQRLNISILSDPSPCLDVLRRSPSIRGIRQLSSPQQLEVDFTGTAESLADLLKTLVLEDVRVSGFWETQSDLEDVFMKITQGGIAANRTTES